MARLVESLPWTGERIQLRADADSASTGEHELVIERAAEPIGRIVLTEQTPGVLRAQSLVIDVPFRGYGAGSAAAHLLLDHAVAAGFQTLQAVAAPHLGLSVYFWTRMGLHPLHGEGPDGGLLFERTLRE